MRRVTSVDPSVFQRIINLSQSRAGTSSHRLLLSVTSKYSVSMCWSYPPPPTQLCQLHKAQLDGYMREFGKRNSVLITQMLTLSAAAPRARHWRAEGRALSASSIDGDGRSVKS